MDIDIDAKTSFNPLQLFPEAVRASMIKDQKILKHPAGVYFQNIPKDVISGLSAIPYQQAEELGYTKIDFLHLGILDHFDNKQQIKELIKKEPNWDLLMCESVVVKLFQLANHYDVVKFIKPRCVEDIADCIAVIRPGKRQLLETYDHENKEKFRKKLYERDQQNHYAYKKGHAISYAMTVVLQLHLIQKGII